MYKATVENYIAGEFFYKIEQPLLRKREFKWLIFQYFRESRASDY